MKRTIISVLVLLAATVALAGCGGSGGASLSNTDTGGAGTQTSEATGGNFSASVHGFAGRLQTSVSAFQHGNIAGASKAAGSLLTNCDSTVNDKIAPKAKGAAQNKAVIHLQLVCQDIEQATQAGLSGKTSRAKRFARAALAQSQLAAKLAG